MPAHVMHVDSFCVLSIGGGRGYVYIVSLQYFNNDVFGNLKAWKTIVICKNEFLHKLLC